MTLLPPRAINLVDDSADGSGPSDTGLSHAIALAAGSGEIGETLRLHPTANVVAFGRQDVIAPGYAGAVAAARAQGFEAVERLAGGRAAVFHTGTLAFSWAIPSVEPRTGVHERFEMVATVMADALRSFGLDARVGEVAGEYCPGSFSVNIEGTVKVVGVGQRLVRGAAHVGGVVVVSGSALLRRVLTPVYAALGLEWDPATAGAVEDRLPDITVDAVRRSILAQVGARAEIVSHPLPLEVIEMGRRLAASHRAR